MIGEDGKHIQKHRVSFEDATTLFENVRITAVDSRQAYGETMKITVGTITGRVCVFVYTERQGTIRISSARKANQREREKYYELIKKGKTEGTR